jgi:hydrogenase maturation protein HypF
LWGGEFLVSDIHGFIRAAHFKTIPLPGGETAIKEPWRTAVSMTMNAAGDKAGDYFEQIGFAERYGKDLLRKVMTVACSSELSPLASGAGRLFDSVSALLGVCDTNTFEGEAAMALEALTIDDVQDEYPLELIEKNEATIIDFAPAIMSIIHDIADSIPHEVIATRFHNTVASIIKTMVQALAIRYGINTVVLSGGSFQNIYLLERTLTLLTYSNVYINQKVPCNDGGISLGQAYLIRERLKKQAMLNAVQEQV